MKKTILHASKSTLFSEKILKYLPLAVRKGLPVEISVVSVSEKESALINRIYRKKHKPANVLSFLYGPEYGEIIVCPSLIRREARKQGHTYQYQMTWMIMHGMIHLSGLHHEHSSAAAKQVAELEGGILEKYFARKKR